LNNNLLFLVKFFKLSEGIFNINTCTTFLATSSVPISPKLLTPFLSKWIQKPQKKEISNFFLYKSLSSIKLKMFKLITPKSRTNFFFFLNRFLIGFLENFFKTNIIFNLKKGSNKLILRQISFRKFTVRYFKKNLKVNKQIIGVIYYSLLLKDSQMFVNFFKKNFEKINIKLHKKLLSGFKKLIKDIFKPLFGFFGVVGIFFNIKGKIGVSGSAKKRRYFFYFGKHSISSRNTKVDLKFTPIWTFTGTLGFSFLIFF
jgi:hypothetical protein